MKVKLKEVGEVIDMQMDEYYTLFDRETYTFIHFSEQAYQDAEDREPFDHLPDWQQEERERADLWLEYPDRFVSLPDKFEINEYSMMEDFCFQLGDERKQERLLKAIRGRGAFRRFKDQVQRWGIDQEWYQFRDKKMEVIAKEWCDNNDINFEA